MTDPDCCPVCGRPRAYLMQTHHDQPGLIDSLKGEGGEARRVLVTIAVCVLAVLIVTGAQAVLFVH